MGGHQIRHEILLFADAFGQLIKPLLKPAVSIDRRLAHAAEYLIRAVLRRHLELTTDMILDQLLEKSIVVIRQQVVETNARTDKHPLDARQCTQPAQQIEIFRMICLERRADRGRQTFFALAQPAGQLSFAGGAAEIGGRAADIVYVSLEARHPDQRLCLADHRIRRAAGDLPSLMIRQGTEVARAEAAAVVHEGKLHLFEPRHTAECFIRRMILPHIRQLVNPVERFTVEQRHRRVLHHDHTTVPLNHRFAAHRILLVLLNAAGQSVLLFPFRRRRADLFQRRALGTGTGRILPDRHRRHRAAHVGYVFHRFAGRKPAGDFGVLLLPHAEHQDIRAAVDEDGRTHPVIPVIVMGKAAQRRLQPAEHNRDIGITLPHPAAVNDRRPVGPAAGFAAGGVGILAAAAFGRRIVRHHRIDIAAADEEAQPGRPEPPHILCRLRLRQDAHAKPFRFQHTGDDRRPKAGMIDIGIAGDHHNIRLAPAALLHFSRGNR